jgi:chromosome segregation ATPase
VTWERLWCPRRHIHSCLQAKQQQQQQQQEQKQEQQQQGQKQEQKQKQEQGGQQQKQEQEQELAETRQQIAAVLAASSNLLREQREYEEQRELLWREVRNLQQQLNPNLQGICAASSDADGVASLADGDAQRTAHAAAAAAAAAAAPRRDEV